MSNTGPPPTELKPINAIPPLRAYLRDLVDRVEYIRAVPLGEIRAKNLDTVLGNVWLLANPILSAGVYFVIFGILLETDRGVDNYITYLIIGIMVFRLFSSSLTGGAGCVSRSETLMRSLYFPRVVVPLASALGNFYLFLPGVAVMLMLAVATGETPTWRWLLLPYVMALALVFVSGVTMITGRLGHGIRDLGSLLPHLTRLGFYGSGTLYDPAAFTSNSTVLWLFNLNPVYQLISLTRWSLMGLSIPGWFWVVSPIYAICTFVGGFLYFYRGELNYGAPR